MTETNPNKKRTLFPSFLLLGVLDGLVGPTTGGASFCTCAHAPVSEPDGGRFGYTSTFTAPDEGSSIKLSLPQEGQVVASRARRDQHTLQRLPDNIFRGISS